MKKWHPYKRFYRKDDSVLITGIDAARCNGCSLCVDHCNMDVLRLDAATGKAFIAYHEDCMTCFECALSCPEEAVEVSYTPEFTPSSIVYGEGVEERGRA